MKKSNTQALSMISTLFWKTGVDISRTADGGPRTVHGGPLTADGGPGTVKRGEFDEMEMAHVAFFKRN